MRLRLSLRVRYPARPGGVLVWVILSLAVLVGVLALTLDGGRLMAERRRAQAVANAAALAAAGDLYGNYWECYGQDPQGSARAAAEAAAVANGMPASAVTVNIPPTAGAFAGQEGYVEVLVRNDLGASFGRVITGESLPVRARAVARGLPMRIGIRLMAPDGADAFLNEAPALAVLGAPVIVNSVDPAAYRQESFGVVVAQRWDITGGFINPGDALMVGKARTGVRPTPDPLVFLPIPEAAGLPVRSAAPRTIDSPLPTILWPGVYRGGLHITGASSVVLLPGVYVMEGGGFVVDGAATVTGLKVMIYNTTSESHPIGPIRIAGLGKVVLTAPHSGTYQGINIFQNRALTTPVTIQGNGLMAITGVVYALQAPVNLRGSLAAGLDILGGAYVARSMTVGGVGTVHVDIGQNPPRIPDVRLVE